MASSAEGPARKRRHLIFPRFTSGGGDRIGPRDRYPTRTPRGTIPGAGWPPRSRCRGGLGPSRSRAPGDVSGPPGPGLWPLWPGWGSCNPPQRAGAQALLRRQRTVWSSSLVV